MKKKVYEKPTIRVLAILSTQMIASSNTTRRASQIRSIEGRNIEDNDWDDDDEEETY